MEYTASVMATNLVGGTVAVSAKSKEEALAQFEQRINRKLKLEGYEIQLEILETVNPA